ncbi:DNA-directed RNA polymerase subunit alpha [Sphingobacterium sp. ML3W]|jgi:DNA-directed RNA polymerase subunit alpha|uniref:DNA-directed RNA polymerase subunit alpha n=4 Tax=Sphingobacterium TaxID=28453 RepID=A0A420AFR3_SPHD1|nr:MULTISPECIES: DNA-directed RNA polymerase subunit alpha [Sphingobacterium]MCS4228571.1 DNA-directed RNA polymerase subunit alpha [Sphingobacterium sp. BIGb0165]NPE45091.1 DNA-directed RNA polymerase subunit alpha [Sphingobacterium prati]OOG16454.1 DNA-directed RNA polymerase subunit alpha [Sphingobacterium sp. CZ-UAM]PUV21935.1 DNA-directed RNA polymerase subunit alpha [Sphingobacterium athyrii]QIH31922.1 DNA-directed RNA polymerase subunit alpha [Sphingobacterium sp. DR205]
MAILAFQRPDKVIMQKSTDFDGTFEFRPLEPGFGVTIGNALRRILLSSLEGYAITSIRFSGVSHEFSTIKGVVEDVTEIILNLKQIRFKKTGEIGDNEKVFVVINGQEQFLAGDITKFSNNFTVLNPDLVICNMDNAVTIELELSIAKGRGYVNADENKVTDAPVGVIAIDSIFTPIKNVKYTIENYRVEQKTDYEKLLLDISTDGSIHPEEALKEAAKILIQHFILFSDENMLLESQTKEETKVVDEEILHMRKILKTELVDLDLSVRALNCLKAADIRTLAELVTYDVADMLKFRNFGKKSLSEIQELVKSKGLSFGMNLAKYKLDEE